MLSTRLQGTPTRKKIFFLLGLAAVSGIVLIASESQLLLNRLFSIVSAGYGSSQGGPLRRPDDTRQLLTFFHPGEQIGTVKVDFYRTYEEKDLLLFKVKQHSIPIWRLYLQLHGLNKWYAGRINFEMGDIISIGDPELHDTVNACNSLAEFAKSDDVVHLDRISALYVRTQGGVTSTCENSGLFVPLGSGGTNGTTVAPAVILGVQYSSGLLSLPFLGLPLLASGTLAMRIGHVIGFDHTAWSSDTVIAFDKCGDTIRYPSFRSRNMDKDKNIFDPITNETYYYSEWRGQTNLMAPLGAAHIVAPWEMGLYVYKYEQVFEAITQCWFDSAIPTP